MGGIVACFKAILTVSRRGSLKLLFFSREKAYLVAMWCFKLSAHKKSGLKGYFIWPSIGQIMCV